MTRLFALNGVKKTLQTAKIYSQASGRLLQDHFNSKKKNLLVIKVDLDKVHNHQTHSSHGES